MNKQEIEKAVDVLKKYHDLLHEVYADYAVYSKAENYSDKSLELASRANTVKHAVDTAIARMEQQLTNEAEIKRLQDENESIKNWNACETEEYTRLLESDKRRIELEVENETLRQQLTNGWISVSENYPAEHEYRDLSTGELIPLLVCVDGTKYPFRAFYDGKNWGDGMFKSDVTAWQLLPEPYKEGIDAK